MILPRGGSSGARGTASPSSPFPRGSWRRSWGYSCTVLHRENKVLSRSAGTRWYSWEDDPQHSTSDDDDDVKKRTTTPTRCARTARSLPRIFKICFRTGFFFYVWAEELLLGYVNIFFFFYFLKIIESSIYLEVPWLFLQNFYVFAHNL